jgi:hypothetical protein
MSDYIPKDPLGPNSGPNTDRVGYDRYGNSQFEPAGDTGKGPYILLGLLVAIGLIGGLLYFNGTPKNENVAQAPNTPAISRTVTPPATPAPATPGTPATPSTTPAPSAAPSATPAPSPSDSGTAKQ